MPSAALLALAILLFAGLAANARRTKPKPPQRELLVPFPGSQCAAGGPAAARAVVAGRVEELQRKAAKTPQSKSPYAAVLLSADYSVVLEPQRAQLSGTLVIDVLTDGLHGVPLDMGSVGLRSATLDGRAASIGQEIARKGDRPVLFVEGTRPPRVAAGHGRGGGDHGRTADAAPAFAAAGRGAHAAHGARRRGDPERGRSDPPHGGRRGLADAIRDPPPARRLPAGNDPQQPSPAARAGGGRPQRRGGEGHAGLRAAGGQRLDGDPAPRGGSISLRGARGI